MTGSDWDPHTGRATQAFEEWRLSEDRLRTFLRLAREFSGQAYQGIWDRISSEPSDGEGPELIDLFTAEVSGLDQVDFNWLLANMVLRDCVTLYEVYLEKVLYETVSIRLHEAQIREKSPTWKELRVVFGVFGVTVDPARIRDVVGLRDLLTHRRGELVTEALREKYDTHQYQFPDTWVRLEAMTVGEHLDALAGGAVAVDRAMWPIAWGDAPIAQEMHDALVGAAPWLFS